ncbi:hypothetical protein SCHPADRAFT_268296 [Schizopora paradoxa]|uniref:DUF6533 domain-containing protein n=1 Tax=Schizopora paradoxa TaxID=27342 RepID=A0A0H2RUN3_9AGAM|nr:hypothetical protein SCHPADRAFT_268296 [Schizopora paradoxa]
MLHRFLAVRGTLMRRCHSNVKKGRKGVNRPSKSPRPPPPIPVMKLVDSIFDPALAIMLAACSIFIYDYFLSLEDEVYLIWTRPWRKGKVAYLMTKAFSVLFVISTTIVVQSVINNTSDDNPTLNAFDKAGGFTYFLTISLVYISAQSILGSRVYALYGNKRLHLVGLILLCCVLPLAVPFIEVLSGTNVFEGLPQILYPQARRCFLS